MFIAEVKLPLNQSNSALAEPAELPGDQNKTKFDIVGRAFFMQGMTLSSATCSEIMTGRAPRDPNNAIFLHHFWIAHD